MLYSDKGLSEEVTSTIPENPEVVVFATFSPVSNSPAPMSIIKEMVSQTFSKLSQLIYLNGTSSILSFLNNFSFSYFP